MKTDLATSILAAVVGVVAAFFITNLLTPEMSNFSIKTLGGSTSFELAEPDVDVFNFRALNPTVEVYVGECDNYDENGNCIDEQKQLESTENEENTNTETNENQTNQSENKVNGTTN